MYCILQCTFTFTSTVDTFEQRIKLKEFSFCYTNKDFEVVKNIPCRCNIIHHIQTSSLIYSQNILSKLLNNETVTFEAQMHVLVLTYLWKVSLLQFTRKPNWLKFFQVLVVLPIVFQACSHQIPSNHLPSLSRRQHISGLSLTVVKLVLGPVCCLKCIWEAKWQVRVQDIYPWSAKCLAGTAGRPAQCGEAGSGPGPGGPPSGPHNQHISLAKMLKAVSFVGQGSTAPFRTEIMLISSIKVSESWCWNGLLLVFKEK